MDMDAMIEQRRQLGLALQMCGRGNEVGSRYWWAEQKAGKALMDFDRANPGVYAEIIRRSQETALTGKDLAGI